VLTPDQAGKDRERFILKTIRTETSGSLSQVDYDILVRDLVNFMTWMSEPNQLTRKQVWLRGDAGSFWCCSCSPTSFTGSSGKTCAEEKPAQRRGARGARAFFFCTSIRIRNKASKHDESLLRNHLPVHHRDVSAWLYMSTSMTLKVMPLFGTARCAALENGQVVPE